MVEGFLENKNRKNLLAFFLNNRERSFFIDDIERKLEKRNLGADLGALVRAEVVLSSVKKGRRYYRLNRKFKDLQNLEAALDVKKVKKYDDDVAASMKRLGGLKVGVLAGLFTGNPDHECDMLLVGRLSERQLGNFIRTAERLMGQELNYVVMTNDEFEYRVNVFDRFIKDIFEKDHILVVDKRK